MTNTDTINRIGKLEKLMLEKEDRIGDYKLEKFLGRGQFGEVWLAEKQLQFGSRKFRHALKFLSNLGDEINLKAAEDEIDTWIEAGGHPNVMSVLDMLVHKEHIIIVSEYAESGSLQNWLRKNGGKAPSEEKALQMMLGILRGIEHLHSRSVVHRDLKPDNILLQGEFPRITDFGISRIVNESTISTKAMGSPAYMSPESFSGNKSPQTDIWSAGVIFYELLTGDFPFENETIYGLVNTILEDAPKPLPETVSPELAEIVETALQKDRTKRFQTAHEMLAAIERANYDLQGKDWGKTLPIEENNFKPATPAEKTLRLDNQSAQTQAAQTQPAKTVSVPSEETADKAIEGNADARKIAERERAELAEREQAELQIIGQRVEQNRGAKKNNNLLLAVGGGITGLLLIGVLVWVWSGNYNLAANTANNSPANNASEINVPNAPTGMVYIAGGEFTMGRDDGKSEAEKPAHKVSVQPFFMDIYETTNEQYAEFVKATNHKLPTEWKSGTYPNGQAKFPVVGVDWNDADDYAKWANKRLPSEEEWEFAARGTNNLLYPWGNDWQPGNANVGGQAFAEVGKFKGASPFGIYDLAGNAFEWTASDFKAYPNGKLPAVFAGKTNLKTIRGGSFEATKDFATTTYRIGYAETNAENYSRTGFRCAKDTAK